MTLIRQEIDFAYEFPNKTHSLWYKIDGVDVVWSTLSWIIKWTRLGLRRLDVFFMYDDLREKQGGWTFVTGKSGIVGHFSEKQTSSGT